MMVWVSSSRTDPCATDKWLRNSPRVLRPLTFRDVCGNGNSGSSHLRREAEAFLGGHDCGLAVSCSTKSIALFHAMRS